MKRYRRDDETVNEGAREFDPEQERERVEWKKANFFFIAQAHDTSRHITRVYTQHSCIYRHTYTTHINTFLLSSKRIQ